MFFHKVAGCIVRGEPFRLHGGGVVIVAAVEKRIAIRRVRIRRTVDLRIPVITGEQLVSTLAALHHFAVLGHFARQ
ncbi:hypothetical protein D3C72_936460 [compost metagenome]